MEAVMSNPSSQGTPIRRRKPELVCVRVVPWDDRFGLYGLIYEFDDGETISEMWGTRQETELAARIRAQDIRVFSRPAPR
jgi:hypothetical protein